MKLKELKQLIDDLYSSENNYRTKERIDELEVVIVLKEPSIGGRAFSKITNAGMGFDWESFRFNLTPEKDLIRKQSDLTKIKP